MATGVMDPRTIEIYSALTACHWEGIDEDADKRSRVSEELEAAGFPPLAANEQLPKRFSPRTRRRPVTNRAARSPRGLQTNVSYSGGGYRPASKRSRIIAAAVGEFESWIESSHSARSRGETHPLPMCNRRDWVDGALAEAGFQHLRDEEAFEWPSQEADDARARGEQ